MYPSAEFERSDLDVVSWLKAEMLDQMNRHLLEEVDGPCFFGFDQNNEPYFIIRRTPSGRSWMVVHRKTFEFIPKEKV